MKDPREWACTDSNPENNGWGWYRWPQKERIEPEEDDYCGEENECNPENNKDDSI